MEKVKRIIEIKNKIFALKEKLKKNDYQAIKFAEGRLTKEEFMPISEQREMWRQEINSLEAELESLTKQDD